LQRATLTGRLLSPARPCPHPGRRLRETDFGALTQHPPSELHDDEHLTVPYPRGEA